MTSRRSFFFLLGLGALLVPAAAGAQAVVPRRDPPAPAATPTVRPATTPNARGVLRRWFQGFEFVPTEAQYRKLGPELAPALIDLASDTRERLLVRARAVSALVFCTDTRSEALVLALLADREAPSVLRRKAALVAAERLSERAVAPLGTAFTAARDDLPLREACARGLRTIGPAAHAARERLYATEPAPSVRAFLRAGKRVGR